MFLSLRHAAAPVERSSAGIESRKWGWHLDRRGIRGSLNLYFVIFNGFFRPNPVLLLYYNYT